MGMFDALNLARAARPAEESIFDLMGRGAEGGARRAVPPAMAVGAGAGALGGMQDPNDSVGPVGGALAGMSAGALGGHLAGAGAGAVGAGARGLAEGAANGASDFMFALKNAGLSKAEQVAAYMARLGHAPTRQDLLEAEALVGRLTASDVEQLNELMMRGRGIRNDATGSASMEVNNRRGGMPY